MNDIFKRRYKQNDDLHILADEIKSYAEQLYVRLITLEKSREQSIAITRLEEAVMWAVKGVYK